MDYDHVCFGFYSYHRHVFYQYSKTIYLLIIGKWGWAIVIFVGCNVISLVVENVYKPKFIGKRLQIDSLLLLFGIIGGLSYFGALGIFYGPIIITMFLTFVQFGEEAFTKIREILELDVSDSKVYSILLKL